MTPLNDAQAAFYATFIAAAYSMFWADESIINPSPNGHGVPAGWTVVAWITMKDFLLGNVERFYGIVAEHPTDGHVVAIRGTGSNVLAEWLEDFDCIAVPFDPVPTVGHVTQGFGRVYGSINVYPRDPAAREPLISESARKPTRLTGTFGEQMAKLLEMRTTQRRAMAAEGQLIAAPPHIVAGHSLGAALATLYVMENMSKGVLANATICTFASPRVGNSDFVGAFNALSGLTSWRIANKPDPAPNLPPDIWGWRHVDQEYLFDSTGEAKTTIPCAHSLQTYVSLLDPNQQPDPSCAVRAEDVQLLKMATGQTFQ